LEFLVSTPIPFADGYVLLAAAAGEESQQSARLHGSGIREEVTRNRTGIAMSEERFR
jgi:hypothetical protein